MDMLEQAIIDAEKLKQTAMQLAEQKILERNAQEIKKVVDSLLSEQDEMNAVGLNPSSSETKVSSVGQPSVVGLDGTGLPNQDDEYISLDLEELALQLSGMQDKEFAEGFEQDEELDLGLENDLNPENTLEPEDQELDLGLDDEVGSQDANPLALEEDLDEELNFDYEVVPHGHLGAPTEREYADVDSIVLAKMAQLKKENQKLKNVLEKYEVQLQENKEKMKEWQSAFGKLQEHVSNVNLNNAKLLYVNKVLGNNSLNERQKNLFVEKLSESKSVEQAKTIFETLKSVVSSGQKPKEPKSLNENLSRNSRLQIPPTKEEKEFTLDPRMKKLAGIK